MPDATTTPAPVPAINQQQNQTPPPNVDRRTDEPLITKLNERIARLRGFHFPQLEAKTFDGFTADAAQYDSSYRASMKLIDDAGIHAYRKVKEDLKANLKLNLLDEKSRKRVELDCEHRAVNAQLDARAEQETLFEANQKHYEAELEKIETTLEGLMLTMPSPAAMLDIRSPASTERQRHADLLRDAPYQSVVSWAMYSMTHPEEKSLAAAIGAKLTAMGKDAPLRPNDFASRVLDGAWDRMHAAYLGVQQRRADLKNARLESMRGKASLTSKIESYLRGKELAKVQAKAGQK